MEKRKLGSTPEMLSVVGFGGIIVMKETPAVAKRYVSAAVERGVNYFDVAPSYGNSEARLGPALQPYRKDVFLACKTTVRNARGAEKELHQSLKRLRTDHIDLYQLHSVTTAKDVQQILAPGGALETFVKARQQGLVRYLGFSAHAEDTALALMDAFAFDSILTPLNWVCWLQGDFGKLILPAAQQKGMGILALKCLCKRPWGKDEPHRWSKTWYSPVDTAEEAALALRFTLSLPGLTAAVSPSHFELFEWMCDAADRFSPLSAEELEALKQRTAGVQPLFPLKAR
jgi:aryl-alcohol dehydrogenase-like predicted oxidoreductase